MQKTSSFYLPKRYLFCLILMLAFIINADGLEVGFVPGYSHFRYAENGEDSKDDLFTLNSIDLGVSLRKPLGLFYAEGIFSAQLPYDLTFEDALGVDEYNYLSDMYYYGLNSRLALGYEFIERDALSISISMLMNVDYFYFEDRVVDYGEKYIFSVLGAGAELSIDIPITKQFSLALRGGYMFNFLPIYDRDADFMWSDNILVSAQCSWSFNHE